MAEATASGGSGTGSVFGDCTVRGLGVDAVDVERFRRVLARRPGFAERIFTARERADAEGARDPQPRLAARFAAKEAVMKALGVGIGAVGFREVEVRRAPSGAPSIALDGRAASLAENKGVSSWYVSLTHTSLVALASVVAVGPEQVGPHNVAMSESVESSS
jgi:holo-[acyl-carrier protein] synthase